MRFKVVISELAQKQYNEILNYIAFELKNHRAVESVQDDFDYILAQLEENAKYFGLCNSDRLRQKGFHKLPFRSHKYLVIYRIKTDRVIIEGIYHELQDYENAL